MEFIISVILVVNDFDGLPADGPRTACDCPLYGRRQIL